MESKKSLGFAWDAWKKKHNIFPNGDLMVMHHGTIRKKITMKQIQDHDIPLYWLVENIGVLDIWLIS